MGEKITIELVRGPAREPSLYVNDTRVAGEKPWGGGRVEHAWRVDPDDVRAALGDARLRSELAEAVEVVRGFWEWQRDVQELLPDALLDRARALLARHPKRKGESDG